MDVGQTVCKQKNMKEHVSVCHNTEGTDFGNINKIDLLTTVVKFVTEHLNPTQICIIPLPRWCNDRGSRNTKGILPNHIFLYQPPSSSILIDPRHPRPSTPPWPSIPPKKIWQFPVDRLKQYLKTAASH